LDYTFDENDPIDPLLLMARKYMKIPCSVMSPNNDRIDLIKKMIRDFHIDGVIDLTCRPAIPIIWSLTWWLKPSKMIWDLPFLHLETDYSQSDVENPASAHRSLSGDD